MELGSGGGCGSFDETRPGGRIRQATRETDPGNIMYIVWWWGSEDLKGGMMEMTSFLIGIRKPVGLLCMRQLIRTLLRRNSAYIINWGWPRRESPSRRSWSRSQHFTKSCNQLLPSTGFLSIYTHTSLIRRIPTYLLHDNKPHNLFPTHSSSLNNHRQHTTHITSHRHGPADNGEAAVKLAGRRV